jgi:EmrB/QacA subfamily drug resistance transporter
MLESTLNGVILANTRQLSRHSENKWVVLALLALAQFMVVLDIAIVNVALPSINRELHFAAGSLQWVITAYTLTFGGFLLLGGRAADLYGRRRIFLVSVTMFAIVSLLCGFAQSDTMLIVTRAIQGLAAAFMSPAALSIVLTEFREGKERDKALGVWAAVAAGGAAAGVLIGGILTQYLSWRWNFFVNAPVGLFVVIAGLRLLPHHIGEEEEKVSLDLPGAALATGGLISLVFGLSKAPTLSWSSAEVWAFVVAGLVMLVLFVWNESKARQPLMPLSLFRIKNVLGGNVAFLAIACSLFSMFFFLTLYVQNVLGYTPIKAGISFLPVTVIVAIGSAVVSSTVSKIGYKPFLLMGPLLLAIGLYILGSSFKVGGTYWANVFPGLATFALGMGFTFVSGTLAATSGVPKHFSGIASGILNTSQQVGGSIGLAILSAVAFSTIKSDLASGVPPLAAQINGYVYGLRVGMGLAAAAAVVVALEVKNERPKAQPVLAEAVAGAA